MFIFGFTCGVLFSTGVFSLLIAQRRRVGAFCNFISSLCETGSSASAVQVLEKRKEISPLNQVMYSEVVSTLVNYGATKAQALKTTSEALTRMVQGKEEITADALLMKAMMGVGK